VGEQNSGNRSTPEITQDRFANLFLNQGIPSLIEPAEVSLNMNLNFGKLWYSAQHMIDSIMARLPSLVVAIAVFILFYILSIFVRRIIHSATRAHRQNLGMAFAR
jgi:hypothetical protein